MKENLLDHSVLPVYLFLIVLLVQMVNFIHICPTCLPPLSHMCSTSLLPRPTCLQRSVPPMSHMCSTCLLPLSHLCLSCVPPVYNLCLTYVSHVFHLSTTSLSLQSTTLCPTSSNLSQLSPTYVSHVLLLYSTCLQPLSHLSHLYLTCIPSLYHLCLTCVPPVYNLCPTSVSLPTVPILYVLLSILFCPLGDYLKSKFLQDC